MVVNDKLNLTMLCDFYELTMSQGYFASGYKDRIAYFDLFFRRCPDGGGFAIAAGLEQIVQYIQDLHFGLEDIAYLRDRNLFFGICTVRRQAGTVRKRHTGKSDWKIP